MSLSVDIEKKVGTFHLRCAFEAENETMALLGASGCGKSMTLRCIAGILRPDRGKIVLNGRTLFDSEKHIDLPPQERRVGYLFQQYALFPHMTVEKNILAGTREGTRTERRDAVQKIMRTLGLEDWQSGFRGSFPAVSSSARRSRVFWSETPSCCCSTSRSPRSMSTSSGKSSWSLRIRCAPFRAAWSSCRTAGTRSTASATRSAC